MFRPCGIILPEAFFRYDRKGVARRGRRKEARTFSRLTDQIKYEWNFDKILSNFYTMELLRRSVSVFSLTNS